MAIDVAQPPISPPQARSSRRTALVLAGGLGAVAIVVRVAEPERIAWLQNFLIVFGSLLVEAMPFVVLGVFVSAVIEVFVPSSAFERLGGFRVRFSCPPRPSPASRSRSANADRYRSRVGWRRRGWRRQPPSRSCSPRRS